MVVDEGGQPATPPLSMKRVTQLVEMRRDLVANRTTWKIGHFPGISYLFLVKMSLCQ